MTAEVVRKVDTDLKITETTKNTEILMHWYPLAIRMKYTDNNIMEKIHNFVGTIGRMKYILPIYSALVQSGQKAIAE